MSVGLGLGGLYTSLDVFDFYAFHPIALTPVTEPGSELTTIGCPSP